MNLKSIIEQDISSVFFADAEEYADSLKIGTSSANVVHTFGSLQNNLVNNSTGQAPLQAFSWMLLVPTSDIRPLNLRVGQSIYINDEPYKITTISDELGVSNVGLKKGA